MILFSRSTGYGFVNYDDPRFLLNNPHVQAGFTRESIAWAFSGGTDYWHPLTWFSHMLDWRLYGLSGGGHHLTSVLWHAVNAVLAFFVMRRLTGAFWTSAFSAALFAWHPLRVESVTWITERKDVMSGCFFLLTLWAYAAYAERRRTGSGAWSRYALTLALFAAGLMCKPVLVTLPVLLLVLDFWPLRRIGAVTWRALLLEKLPFFALSAATAVATVRLQADNGAFVLQLPLDARLGNAVVSVSRYLGKFFWPFDLAVCYPHPGYWPAWTLTGSALLVFGITFVAWRKRNTCPWFLTGWLWFLVMLLPASGVVQAGFQAMADRYTYLPVLGLQLGLLGALGDWPAGQAARWIRGGLAGLLLAACAARTWDQQANWRDSVTLFTHAIAVTERNDVAHGFLGYTLAGDRNDDAALAHCQLALEINPRNQIALLAHAELQARHGQPAEAIATYRKILELNPADAQSEHLLGQLLLRRDEVTEALVHLKAAAQRQPEYIQSNLEQARFEVRHGRYGEALVLYGLAVELDPRDASAHFGRGLALAQLGRKTEALASYEAALRLQPDSPETNTEIGLILFEQRQTDEAATHFRAALARQPDLVAALVGLGRATEQLGISAEATASFEHAIATAPDDPIVRRVWAETLARRGQFAAAVPHYERAVALQPDDASAHAGLGFVLYLTGRRDEAVAEWTEALRLNPDFPGLRERLEKVRAEKGGN